jgi:hypothetical protein
LREILGSSFPRKEIDEILRETSKNGDGKVTYQDFLALWDDKKDNEYNEAIVEVNNLQSGGKSNLMQPVNNEITCHETRQ